MIPGMKKAYLCGAINGCTDAQAKDWREFTKVAIGGGGAYECVDPMRRDYRGREGDFTSEIVLGDYADIAASDVVLVAADRPSWGTAMEVHEAHQTLQLRARVAQLEALLAEHEIPLPPQPTRPRIVAVCGAAHPSPWLQYHTDELVPTLADALGLLMKDA